MNGTSILIRNGSCLDPLHNVQFETKDLLIKEGTFHPFGDGKANSDKEIDAGGRIVVPGGILPSFKIPLPAMPGLALDPVASARALISTGFTTVVVDGITPFTALDAFQQLQRMPVVNKVPIIDVANFQFLTAFLKNGVTNYAAAAAGSLLAKFKGHGISCICPGSTLVWSRSRAAAAGSISQPVPFLGMSIEKIVVELAAVHGHGSFKPGILVETGIEGLQGSRGQLDGLLAKITGAGKAGGTTPLVAMKQLARNALDPDYKAGDISENVSATMASLKDAGSVAGLADIPSLEFTTTRFIDNVESPLLDTRHLIARGFIEGELAVIAYSIKEKSQKDLVTRYWLAGMKLALDMPASLKGRVAFSVMPQLISDPASLASTMACLLNEQYRLSQIAKSRGANTQSLAGDLLKDKILTLPELVGMTRAAPARIFGLERIIGGLGDGQLGDAIVLDARPGDLDRLRDEPDRLHDLLCNPHAVIKGGRVALKNGQMEVQPRGYTILHETPVDPSIAESIEQNIDKQFLKYYSTHLDAKIVPASLVEPAIKD